MKRHFSRTGRGTGQSPVMHASMEQELYDKAKRVAINLGMASQDGYPYTVSEIVRQALRKFVDSPRAKAAGQALEQLDPSDPRRKAWERYLEEGSPRRRQDLLDAADAVS